jgi:sirohydrochlorin ferrochelatase
VKARAQLDDAYKAINEAATGGRKVMLLEGGKDITGEIDLTSMSGATSHTRGPADKKLETNYEVTTMDLDALIRRLMEPPNPGSPS